MSVSGLSSGNFDQAGITYDLSVGLDQDSGTAGEVLLSGGTGRPMSWGSNSASIPNSLVKGLNIEMTTDAGDVTEFDGLVRTTISSTNTIPTATLPLAIDGNANITLNKDSTLQVVGNDLSVEKVPNTLTIIPVSGDTIVYDGSAVKSITLSDADTTYIADKGVEIDLSTTPDTIIAKVDDTTPADQTISNTGGTGADELNVLRVPNKLTAGSKITFDTGTTYDGSGAITISATDTNTEYTGTAPIDVSVSDVISLNKDSTLQVVGNDLSVFKVPNALTAGSKITFDTGTTYDGSGAITISATDTNTEYTGTAPIDISVSDVIKLNKDGTLTTISNKLSVVKVPQVLTFGTGITATPDQAFDGSTAITITSTDADTTLNLIAGLGISIASNGLDRTIAFTKLANSLITSPSGSSTSDIRIQYAPNPDGSIGTTFDGSASRRFRVRNTGFAVEIHPNTETTYTMYRRRFSGSLNYPRQTLDTFYPIDDNFYYNALPRISTEASGDYEVDVSFCMNVDKTPTVNELVYVRLDTFVSTSYPSYVTGVVAPKVASLVPTTGINKTMRYNVKFLVRLGVASASFGFYPAVAQYSSAGTDDSQSQTADILYGQRFGSLIMTIKPLDHWTGVETSSNPFTIPK